MFARDGTAAPLASPSRAWHPDGMARETTEPWTQLATRIPKDLHRRLKLHCVTNDIAVQDFVTQAISEKLGRRARSKEVTR
jgi:hypothetical protein